VSEILSILDAADDPFLVTHQHADRDSLGSAIGLQSLLDQGTVCTPDGVARPARALLSTLDVPHTESVETDPYDEVVVLDAPSQERIAPVDPAAPILIDHHEPGNLGERAKASRIDISAGATAELVEHLAREADWSMTPAAVLPLLVGILDDTGFLASAPAQTVTTAVDLVGSLGDRAAVLPDLMDRSPA
jgi:nanoRNase/pAp phosphatase (c-di-AMP/oligoRNAs hydrolase)